MILTNSTYVLYYCISTYVLEGGHMRKVTSVKLDVDLQKTARKMCIDNDISFSKYIENLIIADLDKKKSTH